MRKAAETEADTIIYDLEDAVSKSKIEEARNNIRNVIDTASFGKKEVGVRINALETDYWLRDLQAALEAGVDMIILPMLEEAWQLQTALKVADHFSTTSVEFIPLLETPKGMFSGKDLALACKEHSNVTGISYGGGDYHLAIGAPEISNRVKKFLNHLVVGFATIGGLDPIATVYTDVHDLEGQRQSAEHAHELGFTGQAVIHPKQINVVNEVFTPSIETYEKSLEYVEAFEATESDSIMVDDTFLDTAIVERYQDIVNRYDKIEEAKT